MIQNDPVQYLSKLDVAELLSSYFVKLITLELNTTKIPPDSQKLIKLISNLKCNALTSDEINSKSVIMRIDLNTLEITQKLWVRFCGLVENTASGDYNQFIADHIDHITSFYSNDKRYEIYSLLNKVDLSEVISKNKDFFIFSLIASSDAFLDFMIDVALAKNEK